LSKYLKLFTFTVRNVQVVDPVTGEVLGSGEKGEICIKSLLVMIGYAGNATATATILDDDGWLHTGKQLINAHLDYVISVVLLKYEWFSSVKGAVMAHSAEHRNAISRSRVRVSTGYRCVVILEKSFAPVCFCPQAV